MIAALQADLRQLSASYEGRVRSLGALVGHGFYKTHAGGILELRRGLWTRKLGLEAARKHAAYETRTRAAACRA